MGMLTTTTDVKVHVRLNLIRPDGTFDTHPLVETLPEDADMTDVVLHEILNLLMRDKAAGNVIEEVDVEHRRENRWQNLRIILNFSDVLSLDTTDLDREIERIQKTCSRGDGGSYEVYLGRLVPALQGYVDSLPPNQARYVRIKTWLAELAAELEDTDDECVLCHKVGTYDGVYCRSCLGAD